MTPTDLGQLLRDLRGERTQTEIAAVSGIPQNTISAYERGEVDVPSSRLAGLLAQLCRSDEDRRRVGEVLSGVAQSSTAA